MESDDINLERFHEFKDHAEIYYAYDFIYRAMDEPFGRRYKSTLLNIGQFLLAKFAMREEMPLGVSLAYVLNTLAKHGEAMGAYKLARFAYSKLQGLRMPVAWQTQVDLASGSLGRSLTPTPRISCRCASMHRDEPTGVRKRRRVHQLRGRFVRPSSPSNTFRW